MRVQSNDLFFKIVFGRIYYKHKLSYAKKEMEKECPKLILSIHTLRLKLLSCFKQRMLYFVKYLMQEKRTNHICNK